MMCGNIMCVSRLALLLGLLLCVGAQLSFAQHWSHGWYPGGKRELDSFGTSEVGISEIKLCEAGECSYLRPQRRSILRNILLDALARELQKRK
uniref:Progonadoliberin n=2 Tax=Pseudocrenilabrinae TaxID=318546 RepID=A0A3Q4HMR4_NEOBR